MMEFPLKTTRERGWAAALLIVWAVLFLPNLRTNPNWYGDEGEWMDKSWTFIHGTPRVGPISNDFIFPYPYPPLYMLVNGALLSVFGNDILVGRALGAVTALAVGIILFWIGTRLKDEWFGFLCAAAFLVYPEAVMNFRWARSHPMSGALVLASAGFLVRYVQEKKMRDIVLAGVLCSLATATNYFTYGMIGVVIVTALFVHWRHTLIAAVTAGAYGALFAGSYLLAHKGGVAQLLTQVARATTRAETQAAGSVLADWARMFRNAATLAFTTPTHMDPARGWLGVDFWLVLAFVGIIFFPNLRFRKWLGLFLVGALYAVVKTLDNTHMFFYPAMVFVPLLALGVAGTLAQAGAGAEKLVLKLVGGGSEWSGVARVAPAIVVLGGYFLVSAGGALGHFRSKIDLWTAHSAADSLAVMDFVNRHTSADDFVILPKQLYWGVRARKAMLVHSVNYSGNATEAFPVPIPRELFWFDCTYTNAKYLVFAYGRDASGRPQGIDAVWQFGQRGVGEIVSAVQAEKWPMVFQQGEYMILANPKLARAGER